MKRGAETLKMTVKTVYVHLLKNALGRTKACEQFFTGHSAHSARDIVITRQKQMGLINILHIPGRTFLRKSSSAGLKIEKRKKLNSEH